MTEQFQTNATLRKLVEDQGRVIREQAAELAALRGEQPAPREATGDVWLTVIEAMHQRRAIGIERYGVPVQAGNGRDALRDAAEEILDCIVYLFQAIAEREQERKQERAET